jgi:hypothetical protein
MLAIPSDALTAFTSAIQGLQNQMALMSFQMGDLATRVSALDGRDLPTAEQFPQLPMSSAGHLPSLQAPSLPLGVHPSAPVPIQQPWMLVHTMASTPAATTTVAPAPSTSAVVLPGVSTIQHPFTDGIFYRDASFQQVRDEGEMLQQTEQPMATELTGKMLRCQVSAAVQLQAAVRGLLARRRVQKMRDLPLIQPCTYLQLHHVEDCDLIRCVGDFQNVVPPTGSVHVVFPAGGGLKVFGVGSWKPYALLCAVQTSSRPARRRHGVIGGSALPSAARFRHRPPRGRLRWSLLRPLPGGHTQARISSRWSPWDPGGWCPPYVQGLKLFLVENNKTSRDVKSLFLGVMFVSCGVILSVVVKLQLEDELHVQVGCSVRRVKDLLGLSPLGLISRLLRGQVSLACKSSKPLYIKRGDVSI